MRHAFIPLTETMVRCVAGSPLFCTALLQALDEGQRLQTENAKLKYRVEHLIKAVQEGNRKLAAPGQQAAA